MMSASCPKHMHEGDTNQSHSSDFFRGKRHSFETVDKKLTKESTFIKKLCQGQCVFVRDNEEGWTTGTVIDLDENVANVTLEKGLTVTVKSQDILLRSEEADPVSCTNLTQVTPVNEASVLECLYQRFSQHIFYTAAGTTIVAVNPFRDMPHLYDIDKIQEYHNSHQQASPHIYIIAEKAYMSMVRELGKINQSIIVSGESGAGKTVSAKHLLRYLTIVSSPEHEIDLDSSKAGSIIERKVLDSNPILEAFGNAATPRNENSSRFGKFIQLQFHRNGFILGGVIQTYLLEKTRVVHQGLAENNFHIFYQLMSLAEMSEFPEWLGEVKSDVCKSRLPCTVPQQAETLSVLQTVEAMADIGVASSTQVALFQVLLAILHLTTLKFISCRDEEASSLSDDEVTNWAKEEGCRLLGITPLSLHQVLLNRNIVSGAKTRRSVFVKPVSVTEARSRRDCLAMLLYARLFDWVVTFINKQIQVTQYDHCINLLDIYGFEVFNINSLEQLCINYANERLQQHYVIHFLRDLQTEYEMEHIPWKNVVYNDNRVCVETLDGPTGVFGVLNEEVSLNRKSNDSSLCSRIVAACSAQNVVRKPNAGTYETKFIVRHYAGEVLYTVDDAATKNKDNIPHELISLLETSSNSFIHNLFTGEEFAHTEQSLTPTKARKKKTLLMKFKSSLDSLMSTLRESDVYYIRCIKPNRENRHGYFDRPYVLEQLQACGTLETVDICRMGYPARMNYHDFIQRYGVVVQVSKTILSLADVPGSVDPNNRRGEHEADNKENEESLYQRVQSHLFHQDGHVAFHTSPKRLRRRSGMNEQEHTYRLCAGILMRAFSSEELQNCHQQFGLHKIFLTQQQLEHLEHTRASLISSLIARAQAAWKGYAQRCKYTRIKNATVKIQALWKGYSARYTYIGVKSATELIQRSWRQHKLRNAVTHLARSSRIVKRSLTKWVKTYKMKKSQALQFTHFQTTSSSSGEDLSCNFYLGSSSETTTDGKEGLGHSTTTTDSSSKCEQTDEDTDDVEVGPNDSSGTWSDDSGVMIRDDTHSFPVGEPSFDAVMGTAVSDSRTCSMEDTKLEGPPAKRLKLSNLHIGNGIVTCRRLTRPGFRFHVKKSVLKHGHVIHQSELPQGLPDALPDNAP